ncbi:MAG: hypothetical protein QOJ09_521 [Actinomycetota bacterium]|nr:hypothetical protein [Actinomycetota bacterium]
MLRASAAVVLCTILAGACGGGHPSLADTRATQARQVAKDAGLPPPVQDLLADAATSATRAFTVQYKLAVAGSTTITQDPPRRRIDLVLGEGPSAVTRSTVTNADGTFACTRTTGPWTCKKTSAPAKDSGPLALGDIEQTTADLAAARKTYTFRIEARTVAGAHARCLVTELKPGQTPDPARGTRGVLCISPVGVPLVIQGGQTTITATAYKPSADASAFKLPAKAS